jgi:hypothetical protein
MVTKSNSIYKMPSDIAYIIQHIFNYVFPYSLNVIPHITIICNVQIPWSIFYLHTKILNYLNNFKKKETF